MANTLVVDDSSVAALNYFDSSFAAPIYDSRLVDTIYEVYHPVSGVKNVDSIRFSVPAKRGGKLLDYSKTVVALNICCTNKDGDDIPPPDCGAAPAQNFTSSIFRSFNMKLNDTTVTHINNYGVYSMLSYLLNTNNNDVATWMSNLLWEKDTSPDWDTTTGNSGWVNRRNHFGMMIPGGSNDTSYAGKFKFSKEAEFYIYQLVTYFPRMHFLPNTSAVFDFELARPDYCFQSIDNTSTNKDINYVIEDMKLLIPCYQLNDKLYLDIEKRLNSEPIRQIFNKTEVCLQALPQGGQTCILDSLSVGRIPSRLYLLCQESSRLNGQFDLNSFKFGRVFNTKDPENSFYLDKVTVNLASQEIEGLNVDTTKNSFKDHYYRLYSILNQMNGKNACSLTYKEWLDNFCVLVWDFSASLNQSPAHLLPLVKTGNLRVTLQFNKPASKPISILCFLEVQSAIEIEKSGKITLDTI